MAGYSGTPLPTEIGLKPGCVLFLDSAPSSFGLDEVNGVTVVRRLPAAADVIVTFHLTQATLRRRFPRLIERMGSGGMVWVCWPKKAAQKALGLACDLDENRVREAGLGLGVVDVKVAALDETWSGLKFVRRRGSGSPQA